MAFSSASSANAMVARFKSKMFVVPRFCLPMIPAKLFTGPKNTRGNEAEEEEEDDRAIMAWSVDAELCCQSPHSLPERFVGQTRSQRQTLGRAVEHRHLQPSWPFDLVRMWRQQERQGALLVIEDASQDLGH